MSKLETLEREIEGLSTAELAQVRAWLDELEADAARFGRLESGQITGRWLCKEMTVFYGFGSAHMTSTSA